MIINSNPAKFLAGWAHRRAVAAYREIQEKKTMQTTEELKREMYGYLSLAKSAIEKRFSKFPDFYDFESAMEAYLEELARKIEYWRYLNSNQCATIIKDGETIDDLNVRLARMTEDRDDLRNRLQAFEFANKAAGEELRKAQETVKRQREYISEMRGTAKASEPQGSTSLKIRQETSQKRFAGHCRRHASTLFGTNTPIQAESCNRAVFSA